MNRTCINIALLIILAVLTIATSAGCGGEAESISPVEETSGPVDTLVLAVTDTIGLEMGDSSYVFGMILQAAHGADGNIIALDMQKACLSVYSHDGEFIGNIGAPGPGPGEFQIPVDFAVFSDGSIAVTDAISRVISYFDADGSYTGMMGGFFPTPPMSIEGCPDGALVGQHMPMIMTGENMEMSLELSKWTDDAEPCLTYLSKPMELEFSGEGQASSTGGPDFDFAVGPDGSVLVAEISDTLFSVIGFSPEGEEFLNIHEVRDRTPMTQEEIDAGGLGMSIMVMNGEASADMNRMETTYPWRNVIGSIGVDSQSRIWVELAREDLPVFQVYDYSGELLFIAVTDVEFTPVTRPSFKVDAGGILAYDQDPMDYPKIYLFELVEQESE
ncbi:MAG: 6-bladed beta-propeller [Candidatus Aegiribacteria sp.]|nr:6-bladed beta-propeller [Candidatus Aegiribacteria sp.]